MTDTRTSDESPLESRLRATGAAFPQPGVPEGAWQENQRLLLATSGATRGPDRRLLVAAAVVVALVLGVGAVLFGGTEERLAGPPASDSDPFAADVRDGKPVLLEKLPIDGTETRHEAVFSQVDGKGLSLCDRYVSSGGSAGGCTPRELGADKTSVAFDWLSGTEGSGSIRGVLGGVDGRVVTVNIWMDNGDRVLADLKPNGPAGTTLFAFTVPASGPRPQRLVAYGASSGRTVLQSVDLGTDFGPQWLRPVSACANAGGIGQWPQAGATGVTVSWGSGDALITTDTALPVCVEPLRPTALVGWSSIGTHLVVLTAPETALVQLVVQGKVVDEAMASPSKGSSLRAAVFTGVTRKTMAAGELVAVDATTTALDRAYVREPASP